MNRFSVMAFDNTNEPNRVERNNQRRYFLPRIDIKKYNALIDGRDFYDQNIDDDLNKYDELRKVTTGRGDDYTTGCLLNYQYYKNHYQVIACDLSRKKALNADSRSV